MIGMALGASIHYQSSVGGFSGALGAGFTFIGLAAIVGVSGLIAVIAALIHRTSASFAFGAFAGGLVIGGLLGTLVGPTYREPIAATGTVKVVLTEPTALEWTSRATCTSVENGSAIASVRADELATLGGHVVWLRASGLVDGTTQPRDLIIGQPMDPDSTPPYPYREYAATGSALTIDQTGVDQRSGTIHFTDLALVDGPPFPLTPPAAHLAGRVEWTCELPAAQGGPDPAVIGRIEGDLSMLALDGGFGVVFQLGGDCADPNLGLSNWVGMATTTNGQKVRGEMQIDSVTTTIALYLDPNAKDTPYRIKFPTEASPGKGSFGLLQPMTTSEFGELKVVGQWHCRS